MKTSRFRKCKRLNRKPKGELLSNIPASFLKPKVLSKTEIKKEYRKQIGYDEAHRLNAGGYYSLFCEVNPIFTSRNSHKKTNIRKHK